MTNKFFAGTLALVSVVTLWGASLFIGGSARSSQEGDATLQGEAGVREGAAAASEARGVSAETGRVGIGAAEPEPAGGAAGAAGATEPAGPAPSAPDGVSEAPPAVAPPPTAPPATPSPGAVTGPGGASSPAGAEPAGQVPDGQVPDGLAVLQAAAERYRGVTAVCAGFVQELVVPLLGDRHSGRGRMCQELPNLFMMRFSDPPGDVLVADGEHLWKYTPSVDRVQVIRASLAGSTPGPLDFRREFLDDPAEKYVTRLDGRETIAGEATHRLVLVPRRSANYRQAVLWIDVRSSLIRRVEIREENGNVRTISLSDIELNATPPADAFRFTPPPGTQVTIVP